ncbi:MAG TPA: hypothetical protein VFR94_06485 [Nitrososphaeraceae archaeon]|nr:hypothetical protein [Nitrososphaeraceae archaeon]
MSEELNQAEGRMDLLISRDEYIASGVNWAHSARPVCPPDYWKELLSQMLPKNFRFSLLTLRIRK